jgi:hypothetical protein
LQGSFNFPDLSDRLITQTYNKTDSEIREVTNAFLLLLSFTFAGLQASAVVSLSFSFFWYVAGLKLVVGYRRFGTDYLSHLERSSSQRRVILGLL